MGGTSINRSLLALDSVMDPLTGGKGRLLLACHCRGLAVWGWAREGHLRAPQGREQRGASVSQDRAGRVTSRSGAAADALTEGIPWAAATAP